MKPSIILTFCLVLLGSATASAQPVIPIIDGTFEGTDAWRQPNIFSQGYDGWAGIILGNLHIQSDDTYFYFAVGLTAGFGSWQSWGFAINTKPGGGTAEVWGYPITYGHSDPPDFVIKGHFGQGGSPYAELRVWDGASWTFGGTLAESEYSRFHTHAYLEVRIPRADLGNPVNLYAQAYISGDNQNEHATFASMPYDEVTPSWNSATTLQNYSVKYIYRSVSIDNIPGWRMISSPVEEEYIGTFLRPVWTQGMPGADVEDEWVGANVLAFNQNDGFYAVNSLQEYSPGWVFSQGMGWLYGHFNDDNNDGTPNAVPTVLTVRGPENLSPSYFFPSWVVSGPEFQFALAGNPFDEAVDWNLTTRQSGVGDAIWIWDAVTSSYKTWNGVDGTITDGIIAPFQGYMMYYTSNQAQTTFEHADRVPGGTFYGKTVPTKSLVFEASSSALKSTTFITFAEGGLMGMDRKDVFNLNPLSKTYVNLSTSSEGRALSINNLPLISSIADIPMDLVSTAGGMVTLRASGFNLPEGWVAYLMDDVTGLTHEIHSDFEIEVMTSAPKAAPRDPLNLNGDSMILAAATSPRFMLIVDPLGTTSTENGKQTTENFQLEQNYPNPFNPSTVVGFRLSVAGQATLKVYDVLGREVAVLVNGTMPAGSHSVTFDASNLTSGVYMYKLEAGGMVMTKRMTVVK